VGLFGFFHVPHTSFPSIDLIQGSSSISDAYGTILMVLLEDYLENYYTYTIDGLEVNNYYQSRRYGGLFSFMNNIYSQQQTVII